MYTIGDFLIRLKNGYMARKTDVAFPWSRAVEKIAAILADEGYLKKIETKEIDGHKKIVATLLYKNRRPALRDVKIISKPSVHRYVTKFKVKKTIGNFGISIVSTSKGIMTGKRAVEAGVGGELLCEIA